MVCVAVKLEIRNSIFKFRRENLYKSRRLCINCWSSGIDFTYLFIYFSFCYRCSKEYLLLTYYRKGSKILQWKNFFPHFLFLKTAFRSRHLIFTVSKIISSETFLLFNNPFLDPGELFLLFFYFLICFGK